MRSTTGGQHSFANIPSADIQRSSFNRSCGTKTTFDAGYLVPIFVDEALPGDTMSLRMSTLARLATPLHPVMDNLFMDSHFFSVPIRLIWDNWQKFNGEQTDPGDSTDFLVPIMTSPASVGHIEGSLSDYFGIPTDIPLLDHSSLWHRAYALIFNEWFRDENLIDSITVDKDDGPDDSTDYVLQRRGKRHDYFTSSLPFAQKGSPVELPLGTSAPVTMGSNSFPITSAGPPTFEGATSSTDLGTLENPGSSSQGVQTANIGKASGGVEPIGFLNTGLWTNINGATGTADLSTATSATINQIREAFQVQRLLERDARGGSRYTEIIRSHFGVTSPDQRLQRPEYLGGGSTTVGITPVAQTSNQDAQDTPQGNLAGYGVASGTGQGFVKSFVEHCIIIGLISVRADLNYQQGLQRMFSRRTRYDFFWPALAHLGEQGVLNKEIWADASANDDLVFGYQERYAEYRYKPSMITGQMRSTFAQTLDTWHLAQDFATLPVLGETFIEENPPVARVIAVPTEPHFLFDAFFQFKHARPMPTYGVPGMIDHF